MPNNMVQIVSPTLTTGEHTICWRWKPGTGTIADYTGRVNGVNYSCVKREPAADNNLYNRTFGSVPFNGNDIQCIGAFPAGTTRQGVATDIGFGPIWVVKGLTDSQSAAAWNWFESFC